MTKAKLTARSLVNAAYDFAGRGWGRAFAILFLAATAQAAIFVGQHAALQHSLALKIEAGGWLGAILTATPAMGALYRIRLGGAALKDLGPGGLQWTKVECGLVGVATLLFLTAVLFCIPAMAFATIATLALYYGAGLGLQTSMQIGSFAFLAVMLAWLYTVLRVSLAAPATAAARQVRVFQTWPLTKGKAASLGLGLLGALLPAVAVLAAAHAALNGLETGDFVPWTTQHWPLTDALGAGAALGLATAFLIPALIAGLFGHAYGVLEAAAAAKTGKASAAGVAPSAEIIPLPVRAEAPEAPEGRGSPSEADIAALAEEGLLEHAMLLAPYLPSHEDETPVREVELPSGLAHSETPPLDDTGGYVWRAPEVETQHQPAKGPEWEALIAALAPGLFTGEVEPVHAKAEAEPAEFEPTAPAREEIAPSPAAANDAAPEAAENLAPAAADEAATPAVMVPAEVQAAEPFIDHLIPAAAAHMVPIASDLMSGGLVAGTASEMAPEHIASPAPEAAAPTAPWPPLRIAAAVDEPALRAPVDHTPRPPKLILVQPLFAIDAASAPAHVLSPSTPHSGRSDERSSGEPASECVDP